jgi:hypothetical protein
MSERIDNHTAAHSSSAIIYVRLGEVATIAVIPSRPPCLLCADVNLDEPFDRAFGNPGLIAMIAGLEAIKLLAGVTSAEARLIEFDGYAATSRLLNQDAGLVSCQCSLTAAK